MEAKPNSHTIYDFGEFRLDSSELMLYRADEEVSLPPKAVETLLALIEHRGQIVSKDQLMEAIWSDAVVEESNLSRYIHVLRSTLGEQADGRPFIETFRRRGYRFNSEVSISSPSAGPTVTPFVEVPQAITRGGAVREATTGNVIAVADWQRDHSETGKVEHSETIFDRPAVRGHSDLHVRNFWISVGTAILILASAGFAIYYASRPPLTDKDVILVADFDNRTGDELFDGTLRQGLSIHLQQSPFLSLFSDERTRHTLDLMKRAPEEKITREIAGEICQRQGLKVFIIGTIYQLGEKYVVTLEAVNAQTSDVVTGEQQVADDKGQVLKALALAATNLRGKLGESLPSIEKPDVLPWEATTPSLEALRMLTLARREARAGNWPQAINFATRAIEIDPDFAMAFKLLAVYHGNNQQPILAEAAAQKAFEMRERAPEFERLQIDQAYYRFGTGEWDKAIEAADITKKLFPRDYLSHGTASEIDYSTGRYREAIDEANAGIEKGAVVVYSTLAYSLRALGRFNEARAAADEGLKEGHDDPWIRRILLDLAFLEGNDAAFEGELSVVDDRPYNFWSEAYRGYRLIYLGKAREASPFFDKAQSKAMRQNAPDSAGRFLNEFALFNAYVGKCKKSEATRPSPLVYAICGDVRRARSSLQEVMPRLENRTLFTSLNKPLIEAAIEYGKGNAAGAIEKLSSIESNFESASAFQVQYLSGQAYLKLQKGHEATAAFQKILEHRGEAPLSPLYPLAYLGLARAQVQTGDLDGARASYEKFLDLWKDADADLKPLMEAKAEYAGFRSRPGWQ